MDRKIKFRAKCLESKEFIYGCLLQHKKHHLDVYIMNENGDSIKVNKESISEYTGLKDKNGVEIYEGDIIEIYEDEIDEEYSWIDEVSWHMSGFFSGDEDLLGNVNFRCKVIGNIYENKELLK